MILDRNESTNLPLVVGTVCTDLNVTVETIEPIDILELRIDMFETSQISDIFKIINSTKQKYGKPIIATIRSDVEGGKRHIDDEERYKIFKEILPIVEIIDVELSSKKLMDKIFSLCKDQNKQLMASYHNFDETPENNVLEELIKKGKESGATFIKIAVRANDKNDLGKLLTFTINNKDKNIVTISLGNTGLASRLINPLVGSLMTYGYIDSASSPGQISVFDIIEHLRLIDPTYNEALINRITLLEAV